jgi:hypothetical protein
MRVDSSLKSGCASTFSSTSSMVSAGPCGCMMNERSERERETGWKGISQ